MVVSIFDIRLYQLYLYLKEKFILYKIRIYQMNKKA